MRKIIKSSLLFAIVASVMAITSCSDSAGSPENGIGLQLYSVRDAMSENPVATIQKVGEMGYDFVEAAGYSDGKFYDMSPEEYKQVVEKAGMLSLGSHAQHPVPDSGQWEEVMSWWDVAIAAHKAAGMVYIVQPSMSGSGYQSLEGLQAYCDYFNAVGEKCNAAGIRFGYHNHDREFSKLDDQVIYDYMLQNTDPEKVMFQLDLYWISEGGAVATEYFTEYPGRFYSFHIKDEKELGKSGKMDFQSSFDMSETAGTKYMVVEVERYDMDPIESVKVSLDYLKEIGFVK